ncbi:MAG: glutamine synthetase type III, partial [Atopobiaceae bacterium]|nr:glutamine synthetase type III [Atopobiaceae bacterium]
ADFVAESLAWIKATLTAHQRIIFNGNGYSEEWPEEAEKRGLLNMRTTPDCLPCIVKNSNIALFAKYGVLSEPEVRARYVSKAEQYAKLLNIEAGTMVYMTHHMYLPALFEYSGDIATTVATKAELGIEAKSEKALVERLTAGIDTISAAVADLEAKNDEAKAITDCKEQDDTYRDSVIPAMDHLREAVDAMEKVCGHDYWPVPSYNKMLFYV